MKKKNQTILSIILSVLVIVILAGCLASITKPEEQEEPPKEESSTIVENEKVLIDNKLIIGTYKNSVSQDGDKNLLDGALYQGYLNNDNTQMSGIEECDRIEDNVDYGIDLAEIVADILFELDDEADVLTLCIYLKEAKPVEKVLIQCLGIDKVTFAGVDASGEPVSLEKEVHFDEEAIVKAEGLTVDVGALFLTIEDPERLVRDGGYIKTVISSNNGVLLNIYENGAIVKSLDLTTADEQFKEIEGYNDLVFIELTDVMKEYIGDSSIKGWAQTTGNYVEVCTRYTYANYSSAPVKITEGGLYLINIPTVDLEVVEVVRLNIYEETVVG